MFIPLRDENHLKSIPFQYVTVGLIAANVIVFILEVSGLSNAAVASFAVTPRELFGNTVLLAPSSFGEDSLPIGEQATLLTYMFFHADVFHLVGNMLFLWVFGDNVEDAMGHTRFLAFYLACGVFAGLFHAWMLPDSDLPLIGASGAVAGVIAAYLMLHPRVGVWVLAFKVIPLRITAGLALGVWIALQVVMVAMPDVGPVAWWAHIGGLIAGAVLILFMRRPGVPLFDRDVRLAS
ncbi:MAG: rhomboid family intramembrane serine protease [Hyphomicrobium sp.]|uniref:rhomboid family intramembrane serine protease n=1 Tax=Hyphomicrobium sp. TaxID=82 RepID=UPI00132C499E|nr:rhomboid family intramembrane serine protease [Hyphomicrobium sp.]KAB2937572.1 MAG: rhomboid family intramembrane serine protease [Hyphomicrobium sp.]MBZ0209474.1 rhomboid family intramembrane serine protease [Hyphomicrobium sp.]